MSEIEVYQIDLDEELLSHLVLPESISVFQDEEFSTSLIEDDFIKDVYKWQIAHIHEHHRPATASVLADEFDLDFSEPLTAPGDLVGRLRERYVRNNARKHMEAISKAYQEDPARVIDVLPRVAREIVDIAGPRVESYGSGDYERAIQKYNEAVVKPIGPGFGFREIDAHFHAQRGIGFLIGAPKTGKSWLGVQCVVDNVINNHKVEIASLELPAHETDMRIRCLAANVPYWKFVRMALSQEDKKKLKEASELLDETGAYKVVKPAPGHRSFEEMWNRAYDNGAELLIVDQLQYVETRGGVALGGGKPQDFWQPLNAARDMSDDMPLMVIHQFNRSVMNADKMPEMQQAKGASAIEEVATLALGIWANKDMRRSGILEVGTLASRNFTYESWEIELEMNRGCNFELVGRVERDE